MKVQNHLRFRKTIPRNFGFQVFPQREASQDNGFAKSCSKSKISDEVCFSVAVSLYIEDAGGEKIAASSLYATLRMVESYPKQALLVMQPLAPAGHAWAYCCPCQTTRSSSMTSQARRTSSTTSICACKPRVMPAASGSRTTTSAQSSPRRSRAGRNSSSCKSSSLGSRLHHHRGLLTKPR